MDTKDKYIIKYIPYELAIMAKEKGFNALCQCCYDKNQLLASYGEVFDYKNYNNSLFMCSAPTYQQLLDWFREEKDIHISIQRGSEYIQIATICTTFEKTIGTYVEYYEALETAIKEAFGLLK